jgi:NAD(P)-dependent dehydrogenase (short-subunit alcohol dehydrogenase family)
MNEPTILILGGYGNTGKLLARFLLQESRASVVLAGRNQAKADTAAAELNRTFDGHRASGLALDASNLPALVAALKGVTLLLAASSTAQYAETTARACLAAGVDYFDIQFSVKKVAALRALSADIKNSGRCFVTDGGFHPGLPAALIRYAAPQFDELHSANVGSVIKIDWSALNIAESTAIEMAGEFSDFDMRFFQHGRWKKARMDIVMDTLTMDFGAPFGKQMCMPMFLEELRPLPDLYPSLLDTGFFVGGFNPVVDWFLMPLLMLIVKVAPQKGLKPAGNLLLWGLQKFTRPPYDTRLKLEADGLKNGEPHHFELTLRHEDGYVFTAIPAAATILQLLDGSSRKPGLFTQGEIVEPVRLLKDMERMGIALT